MPSLSFWKLTADRGAIADLFSASEFDVVINLAAQAGVRYSLENPHAYSDANLTGFLNILEVSAPQAKTSDFRVIQLRLWYECQDAVQCL